MPKRKAKSSAQLKKEALTLAQKLGRISHADDFGYVSCVTCGVTRHYADRMHGGHFIPKGRSSRYAFAPENIHPQCNNCNLFKMGHGTASFAYTLYMQDMYGREMVQEMLDNASEPVKRSTQEYRDIIAELKEQIKYHEARISG